MTHPLTAYQGASSSRDHQRVLPMPEPSRRERWLTWEGDVDAGRLPWLRSPPAYQTEYRFHGTQTPWALMRKAWRVPRYGWLQRMFQDPPDVLETRALAATWKLEGRWRTREEARNIIRSLTPSV